MCNCPTKVWCNCHAGRHNTATEMHELISAWAGGEVLECREIVLSGRTWSDRPYGYQTRPLNFAEFQYRVKKVPRTLYTLVKASGDIVTTTFSRELIDAYKNQSPSRYGPYTVIESAEKL